jgi:hypothetical protein
LSFNFSIVEENSCSFKRLKSDKWKTPSLIKSCAISIALSPTDILHDSISVVSELMSEVGVFEGPETVEHGPLQVSHLRTVSGLTSSDILTPQTSQW